MSLRTERCRRGAGRSSAERERSEDSSSVLVGAGPMFSGGGHLSAAQQAFWTIALQRTLAPARKTRRPGPARTEGRTALRAHPSRPSRRATASPAARVRGRPIRPLDDPPTRSRPRPTRPSTVTAGADPVADACRRSGPGARPSVRVSLGAAGFPGGGMWPLKRHRPKRLLRCAHEPAAGKHGNPLREDDTAVLAPLSLRPDERPAAAATTLRSQAHSARGLTHIFTTGPPSP